jgi:indole-3-glycerol phosphate synthase
MSETVLDQICNKTRAEVARRIAACPLETVIEKAKAASKPRGFEQALRQKSGSGDPALIAEVKKASPSKGIIRTDFNPAEIAQSYERGGASCLSVLTDIPYFQGHDSYLEAARGASTLPVLRKDFMLEPYQIYESRALGADCVLLIMAALDDSMAASLQGIARDLGMSVLVEVHDAQELSRAVDIGATMIGVNARNLKTLVVDTQTSLDLADKIPDTALKIAESGIHSADDLQRLQQAGYQAFLVGESLMRQENIESATRLLLQNKK